MPFATQKPQEKLAEASLASFTDAVSRAGDGPRERCETVVAAGIQAWDGSGRLNPGGYATRAQAPRIAVERLLQKLGFMD
ncbi:hypothetical protein [Cohnella faecalis]|uniref:SLH domain-containing protein n=1 Tax=Cohnella faecalis TaxID=2315694 RepID=A0A398CSD6_9BACL|nr:hypothetical protein [Cohnella faecalis]RIE02707.1 hypothetical protein D3H35_18825 [Cohnella faecalis]